MFKQFSLVAIALVAAVSIGCSGAAPPTSADVKANPPPAAAAAVKAASETESADGKADPDAGAAAMGNKFGADGKRTPAGNAPAETPK